MVKKLVQKWGNISIKYKMLIPIIAIVTVFFMCIHIFVYISYRDFLLDNVKTQGAQVVEQTGNYSDQVLMKILESFYYLELDQEFKQAAFSGEITNEKKGILKLEFQKVCDSSPYIDNVFLFTEKGELIYNTFRLLDKSKEPYDTNWYKLAEKNPNKVIWQTYELDKQFQNSPDDVFRIIKKIEKENSESAILVFELNAGLLKQNILNAGQCNYANIIILDTEMNDIFKCDSDFLGEILQAGNKIPTETPNVHILQSQIKTNGWRILYVISKSEAIKGMINPLFFVIAPIIMLILLFAVTIWGLTIWLTRPIKKLITLFKKVEDKDFSVAFNAGYNDEIGVLGRAFNEMVTEIDRLMNEIRTIEFIKSRIQLNVLQEQINSHFLYNTLDAVYWEAISGNNEKVADIILNLSQFFRLSLNNGKFEISVAKEVEQIRSYINILKLRNNDNDRITVNVSCDESLNAFQMPKLILQPLVENAIIHGINGKQRGTIDVRIYRDAEIISIDVIDDGGKMDVDKMYEIIEKDISQNTGKGVAILNIHERLRTFYGDFVKMEFFCQKDVMSKVSIRIKNVLDEEQEHVICI